MLLPSPTTGLSSTNASLLQPLTPHATAAAISSMAKQQELRHACPASSVNDDGFVYTPCVWRSGTTASAHLTIDQERTMRRRRIAQSVGAGRVWERETGVGRESGTHALLPTLRRNEAHGNPGVRHYSTEAREMDALPVSAALRCEWASITIPAAVPVVVPDRCHTSSRRCEAESLTPPAQDCLGTWLWETPHAWPRDRLRGG